MKNYIEEIKIPQVKEFVEKSIERYGTTDKTIEANVIADVVYKMLEKRKLISAYNDQTFVDYMLASALLHNLFVDSNKVLEGEQSWIDVFKAREILMPIADECGIHNSGVEPIFSPIEAQLGPDSSVFAIVPKPGTPTELIADAIWFIKEYKAD